MLIILIVAIYMLIGNSQRVADKALNVSIGGNVLTQVNSVWYLGVLIDLIVLALHIRNYLAS